MLSFLEIANFQLMATVARSYSDKAFVLSMAATSGDICRPGPVYMVSQCGPHLTNNIVNFAILLKCKRNSLDLNFEFSQTRNKTCYAFDTEGRRTWFFSLNTNNLALTVLRSTASLFFHTLYNWIVNQSPIALTYLLPHCKGYERGELTFWRQMRHYRSFQMVKRPQTGTIKSAFNHTSLKWHELLILQRKKGPKYFCQIFSSNVFLLLWYVLSLSVLATSWIRVIRPTI